MTQELEVQPSYIRLLQTGELPRRVEALEALLERCTVCPRDCLNNRLQNEIAACYSGRLPIVSSYTPALRRGAAADGSAWRRQYLFRQLQSALRLLSELSNF